MRPWWERDPERLQIELQALNAKGYGIAVDERAQEEGWLKLEVRVPRQGGELLIQVVYPPEFPFFKPAFFADDISLPRHQNPSGGELCLLGRSTSNWHVDDTAAGLISSQLDTVMAPVDVVPTAEPLPEEPIGEPASEYFNSQALAGSYLLIHGGATVPAEKRRGTFVARTCSRNSPADVVKAYVAEIYDEAGEIVWTWQDPVPAGFMHSIRGTWVRRDAPMLVPGGDLHKRLTEEEQAHHDRGVRWPHTPHARLEAVIWPDEVAPGVFSEAWVVMHWIIKWPKKGRAGGAEGRFVRVGRVGEEALGARMPAVAGLRSKRIALVGLGALGAPACLELARSGVGELILVDNDVVDPATVRRWPIGWPAFGEAKALVLKERIEQEYPWTKVTAHTERLGAAFGPPTKAFDVDVALAGVDLVLDATAEVGVNHFLSEVTRIRSIPYVLMNATPGARGGMVAAFNMRGGESCWLCLRHALYADSSVPLPPTDETGELQPAGCGDRTFAGSSFDLQEVALEAVRVIAGHLAAASGYPPTAWQLSLLHLRSQDGARVPLMWEGLAIPKLKGCLCQAS